MLSRKYVSDYSVGYETGKNGKPKPVAAYTGAHYAFDAPVQAAGRMKLHYLLAGLLSLVLLVVLLWFTYLIDPEYRFLSLPMSFDLIALALVLVSVWRVWTAPAQMTREQSDKITNRLPPASLFFMVLSVLSFAATVAHLILCGLTLPMALYSLDALALAACSVWLFQLRRGLKTHKL